MKKEYVIIGIVILIIIIGGIVMAYTKSKQKANENTNTNTVSEQNSEENKYSKGTHHAEIVIKDYGTIKLELDADTAPITVANFAKLAEEGFYDGLTFHRIISGFMIQGGCPQGTGMGGPGYSIKGEFSSNGFTNNLRHERGVISMARTMMPNSAGSQFFIMHKNSPHLDGQYAGFGRVIEGMDVVDEIANTPVDRGDRPKADQRIKTMTVEKFGVDYPEVEKM